MGSRVGTEKELGVTRGCSFNQSLAIIREFGHRLAKVEGIATPRINREVKVVCSDGGSNGGTAFLDGLNGGARGAVLQNDAELGEFLVQKLEGRQKLVLSVKHMDIMATGALTMQVKNKIVLLHGSKSRVEGLVAAHAMLRVGGDASRVAFDTSDAKLGRFGNDFGG